MVPTYDSQRRLDPAELNPKTASVVGRELADVGDGLKGLGDQIQKLDDRRQTLKAQTSVARQHLQIARMAATDPDIDTLNERVDQKSQEAVSTAADLIKSPKAREDFIASANVDVERRNASVYNTILRRKSQDFKNELVQANDADVQEYQGLADKDERTLVRQRILDRTNQAVKDGHVNADWAHVHAITLLKAADLNQVKSDMAISPTQTYEQLQKGQDGLYPHLNEAQRKQFADRAQKMITKEGSDNKLIFSIAQNHAENQLLDKMAKNQLTQDDINNAQLTGINGVRIRPEFAKAATDALEDPFQTESAPDKYNKLLDEVQSGDTDPMTLKMKVLGARGLTLQEKGHLINAHLREDQQDGKQSIQQLIAQGVRQNKQALMQADKDLKAEIKDRQSLFRKISGRFRDQARDDEHLAGLQRDYYDRLQNVKNDDERLKLAQDILNHDALTRNPGIATADPKGTVFMDKTTGVKRRYYPSGFWEPVKTNEQ